MRCKLIQPLQLWCKLLLKQCLFNDGDNCCHENSGLGNMQDGCCWETW